MSVQRHALVAVGAVVIAAATGLGSLAAAGASGPPAPAPVDVKNTASEPVPVNVLNAPSTQPVSGVVGIDSAHNVVTIGNDGTSSVPVQARNDVLGVTDQTLGDQGSPQAFVGSEANDGFVDASKYRTVRYIMSFHCSGNWDPSNPPMIKWVLETNTEPTGFGYLVKGNAPQACDSSDQVVTGTLELPGPWVAFGAFFAGGVGSVDAALLLYGSTL